ncbi:gephyrin-like molybdotransferase receptor GlpR [Mycobacterium sp. AMU20-3851]|uniref:divisome protein SepX/GlpR n=1 Tax=Mycobacterium sp. AMU20-3851 TaxID=3122055 RepID=UPI0037545111
MPSIPQSLLWISLVVLWLFVLVPMLVSKRDNVRRTSDVALATRVLNSGRNARLRRPRAAAGHHSDPDWRPAEDEYEADFDDDDRPRSVVLAAAAPEVEESPYLDVDVVDEDSGALPIGESFQKQAEAEEEPEELTLDFDAAEPETAPQPVAEATEESLEDAEEVTEEVVTEDAADEVDEADDYEYVDDTSGLEAEDGLEDDDEPALAESMASARRNRYESKTAQAVSARKYTFRKRVLLSMAVVMVISAVLAAVVSPTLWWLVGSVVAVTVLYLAYLRRQTRIEEQLRRRRAQRVMRSRLGVENTGDGEFDVVPSRLRRPGAAVLEIDDEDPAFEHLAYARFSRDYDLPRAAGQ